MVFIALHDTQYNMSIGFHIHAGRTAVPPWMTAYQSLTHQMRSYQAVRDHDERKVSSPHVSCVAIHGSYLTTPVFSADIVVARRAASFIVRHIQRTAEYQAERRYLVLHIPESRTWHREVWDEIGAALRGTPHDTPHDAQRGESPVVLLFEHVASRRSCFTTAEWQKFCSDVLLEPSLYGICIDTAHIHGSGAFDMLHGGPERYIRMMRKADLPVRLLHLNGSLSAARSGKDQHTVYGETGDQPIRSTLYSEEERRERGILTFDDFNLGAIGAACRAAAIDIIVEYKGDPLSAANAPYVRQIVEALAGID